MSYELDEKEISELNKELGSKIPLKVKKEEIFYLGLDSIEFHKLANEHPKMDPLDFQALKYDIELNGQREPIVLYRNKLVDGRHRYWILKELNINEIKCKKLPNNLTLDQVREYVMSTELRRSMTKSQKAIQAYFNYKKDNNGTQKEYALKYGVDVAYLSRCKKIEEHLGSKVLKELFNKGKVKINGRYYSNLTKIVTYINKQNKEIKFNDNKEPSSEVVKNIAKEAEKAYINGNLKDLQDALRIIKEKHDLLLKQ